MNIGVSRSLASDDLTCDVFMQSAGMQEHAGRASAYLKWTVNLRYRLRTRRKTLKAAAKNEERA